MPKSDNYEEFVEKFKPKKTTDDCYTPANVYEAVLSWVCLRYGIDRADVVRPFWPGGDYQAEDYAGKVVVDNPPFSIITKVCNWYNEQGVLFFLFAPYLTNFSTQGVCHVVTDADVRYMNGAVVNTAFVTNLETRWEVMSAPDLNAAIIEADRFNRSKDVVQLPKYHYPDCVLTATFVGRLSRLGIDYALDRRDCERIRALDMQREHGKTIFGSGYLLSERAAAERAAAERAAAERAAAERAAAERAAAERAAAERAAATRWKLSEREKGIQRRLDGLD